MLIFLSPISTVDKSPVLETLIQNKRKMRCAAQQAEEPLFFNTRYEYMNGSISYTSGLVQATLRCCTAPAIKNDSPRHPAAGGTGTAHNVAMEATCQQPAADGGGKLGPVQASHSVPPRSPSVKAGRRACSSLAGELANWALARPLCCPTPGPPPDRLVRAREVTGREIPRETRGLSGKADPFCWRE
jgi:hypothetical protein